MVWKFPSASRLAVLMLPLASWSGEGDIVDPQARGEELAEVLVSGEQPEQSGQKVINWLAEMAGKFTLEGGVRIYGRSEARDPLPVRGTANCMAFGLAPGVRCEVDVHWPEVRGGDGEVIPGGVSTMNPGMILYGFDPRDNGISYMMVNRDGVGERAVGLVFANTMVSKAPCAEFPGACVRTTRITVEPDGQVVRMRIDLEIAARKAAAFEFLLRRVPGSIPDIIPGAPQ